MSNQQSRRKFLGTTVKATAFIAAGMSLFKRSFASSNVASIAPSTLQTGFEQTPLPYAYNALETMIDAQTMEIHYTKHAAAYCKNLKEATAAESVDTSKPLEELLKKISFYSMKMRNNAGGHFNHEAFWKMMRSPRDNNAPDGKLLVAIEKNFSTFTKFKESFSEAAKGRFGSGWAWLYIDAAGTLKIGSTPNQDNPLMDISEIKGFPLLGIDVWEHAYYLKYQNRRAEYIENWWKLVNWDYVLERYNSIAG